MDPGPGKKGMKREDRVPQKILVVKLSAIGDVIQTLPMVTALRRNFPQARIDWLVEEEAAGILQGFPDLDRVLVSRRKSWQKRIQQKGGFRAAMSEMIQFLHTLREEEYDWVIDNHGVLKSGVMVALSRGKRKIGYRASSGIADEGNYLFTNERYKPLSIERHALDRYLDLVAQLGVPIDDVSLEYPVASVFLDAARNYLSRNEFNRHPLVILHAVAKWETKQWPAENFALLADRLVERGAGVVMTGSPQDAGSIGRILGLTRRPAEILDLSGKTSLSELAGLFSLSDLVITPDTGPMHLAAAVKVPLIALFGPTAPWRTGPYSNGATVLRKELACSPCFQKKCAKRECMRQITVEEVLTAAEEKIRPQGE
jgi:heptosyltransferase I